MNIEITCPSCKFSRTVSSEAIPPDVSWVICPACKHKFEFVSHSLDAKMKDGSPWERRTELGLWQGIYRTFISVLFSPTAFFMKIKPDKGLSEPLAFGLLLGSLGLMFGFFWDFLLVSGIIMSLGSRLFEQAPLNWIFFAAIFLSPLLVLVDMFAKSAVLHVLMLIFGSGKRKFEGTFRVVAYGQSTKVLSIIPFVGNVTGWIWNIIVVISGLKEIHKTSRIKAGIAVIVLIILKGLLLLPFFLLKAFVDALGLVQ